MNASNKHLHIESEKMQKNEICFGFLSVCLHTINNIRFGFLALVLLLFAGSFSFGQTFIIDPAGDGGFENGTTFAANGWTLVGAANNYWEVGAVAIPNAGSYGVYVTNSGAAYSYNTTGSRTSHFYRDIAIPACATNLTLSFYWKGKGEVGWDRCLVYTAPTTVTPVSNSPASSSTTLTGATLRWTQPNATQTTYTLAAITGLDALAGTTVRFIFTWQNDISGGTSPGTAIDNISLTYLSTPAISSPTSASVLSTSAVLGGNITSVGCSNVTERGIYYSTTNGFADGTGTKVSETPGPYSTGVFTENVTGLTPSTVYYYKAFATNSSGSVYTTQGTFTTPAAPCYFLNATAGTVYGEYTSVKSAFDAINAGTHKGTITITVGNTNGQTITETAQAVLNKSGSGAASYTSVTISPAYSGITITSSALTSSTLQLNYAENVTIDGRIGLTGTTKDLTIENSNTGSTKGAIEFFGASNNVIRYCTLKSSTTSGSGGYGTVSFNYNTNAGCSNNLIEYCNITKSGANLPWVAIASVNTSSTYPSQNNTIRYCNIYDFKRAGIWLGNTGNTNYHNLWTIDNNVFYQSASVAINTSYYDSHAIYIGYHASGSMSSSYNDRGTFTISNNTIGGNGAGGNWTITGTSSNNFVAPIYVAASNPSAGISPANYTYVYGNTIKDFNVQTQYFAGICADKSKAKIGDTLNGYSNTVYNIILDHSSTSGGGTAAGVYLSAAANYSNFVSNNIVRDITADAGSGTPGFWYNVYGIYAYSGSSVSTSINNRNKVYNISTTKAPSTYGMYMDGNCELNHVSKIKINHATGLLFGLYWVCTGSGNAANYRVENNEIILGLDKDGNVTATAAGNDIIGLYLAAQDVYAYYNSILIQGNSASDRSSCLRLNFSGTGATIKNNLLYNNRTGGAGKHMCISTAIGVAGNLGSSNNAYLKGITAQNYVGEWGTGTGVSLGYTAGSLKSTLADWVASATNETNSIYGLSTDANRDIATMFPSANVAPTSTSYNLLPITPDKWLCHGIDIAPKNDFANPLGIVRPNGGNPGDTTTIGAYEISCNTVLPVELLSFESSCIGNGKVLLSWSTATETNNNYFTIEKSSDGVNFEPVIRVEGAGNSNQLLNYNAIDDEVSPELTYYRLRQTDFDGSISYSEIISADCSQNQFSLSISPNPVWEHIDIYVSGTDIQSIKISMINCIGQEIAIISTIADNKILVSFPEEIPAGQYIIKVSNDDNLKTCKILKM